MLVDAPFANVEALVKAAAAAGRLGAGENFFVGGTTLLRGQRTGSDTTNRGTLYDPYSTLDYATGICTAGRHDNVICLPTHTVDITAASGITCDIAGVTYLGIGTGDYRPTVTCSGTDDATNIVISAKNVTFDNFLFDMTGNDSVASFITLTAADCTFRNCRFLLADSTGQVDIGVTVSTGAHRCKFIDCEFFGDTADSVAIAVGAVVTELHVERCKFDVVGSTSPGLIEFTAAATSIFFKDVVLINRVASATTTVDFNANACTGTFINVHSVLGTVATAGSGILPYESTGAAAFIAGIQCYCVNDQAASGAGEAGALVGAVST